MADQEGKSRASVHQMSIGPPFATLTKEERLYAHHLARAAWHGARIILEQVSPEANDIFDLIMEVFRSCNGDWEALAQKVSLDMAQVIAFVDYAATFLSNIGNYFGRGDRKFVPEIDSKTLEIMASVSSEATTLYDKIRSRIFSIPPYSLGFPSDTTQSQYYPPGGSRLTKDEINAVSRTMESNSLWPENTRLRKADPEEGVELFYVLQASAENGSETRQIKADAGQSIRVLRGDHSPALSKICIHLKEALKYAANEKQKFVLEKYIESFTTGDLEAYRESQRIWIHDKNPHVENILGFVEPYRDPAGIRAEFEGLVAIESPQESRVLKQFVENSDQFIRQLPWTRGAVENNGKGPFEKALFEPPSFASVHTMAYCSTILFDGINLPNYNDIRQRYGFKNLIIANRMTANSRTDVPYPFIDEAEVEQMKRHEFQAQYLWLVIHELLGHGTGKMMMQDNEGNVNFDPNLPPMNPLTVRPIENWYKPGETWTGQFGDLATTVDECRCELVGACLMDNKDLLDLFGFNESSDLKPEDVTYYFYLHLCTYGLMALSNFIVESQRWGQAHSRVSYLLPEPDRQSLISQAHFAMLKCLLINGKGCVRIDHDKEQPRLTIRVNRQRIISDGKPALEEMLLRLHMYRVTADVDVCRPYYENLSTVEDEHLEWRRTLSARKTPRLHYVHANTFLEGDNVILTEYEASHAGIIQSWFERAV